LPGASAWGKKVRAVYRHYNRDSIEDWSEPSDALRWKIEVVRAGRYEVVLEYGCPPGEAGSRYEIRAGRSRLEAVVQPTAGRLVFQPFVAGTLTLERGPAMLEIQPQAIRARELMTLHKVWVRWLA
jgi:hypothetical protein